MQLLFSASAEGQYGKKSELKLTFSMFDIMPQDFKNDLTVSSFTFPYHTFTQFFNTLTDYAQKYKLKSSQVLKKLTDGQRKGTW